MHRIVAVLLSLLALCSANDGGFREFSLYYHNYFRTNYGLQPLELSTELNIIAHSHAERLASTHSFNASESGYGENLWAHQGPLRPLTVNCRDAINNWFTGSKVPGNVVSSVNREVLMSNTTKIFGIGVGTDQDYTVVVANYL